MKSTPRRPGSEIGLSLIDMLATVAIISTISAIAVPQVGNALDSMRLGMSARDVERELQYARLKAVSANRPMRVRFDCPSAGKLRVVEVIGTATTPDANDADAVTNRCSEALYPYSPTGADRSRLTRPNNDGPVRTLYTGTTFTAKQTLEFWPNGTVHDITAGYPQITTVTLTMLRKTKTKNITVNGLGKILVDR